MCRVRTGGAHWGSGHPYGYRQLEVVAAGPMYRASSNPEATTCQR